MNTIVTHDCVLACECRNGGVGVGGGEGPKQGEGLSVGFMPAHLSQAHNPTLSELSLPRWA